MAELLSQGRKIEAIRQYQERTGAGLSEAKSAVEALERGEAHASRQTSPAAMASGEDAELLELLRQGQKIPAIKRYRERNSCDLRGAKEAVEALAARHGLSSRGAGCLGITALAIMVGVGVLISLR
ncbi:MAG TPA: hypothetical protein VL475_06670 [Planctomycetaceae bacterium]|jgi:ribosomal protein L7/L12|nr:hypothetical protein [Planctomycetaceae bacterium]